MTLFNDQGGQSGAVTANLFTISRCDGNVGDSSVAGDTTVTQVTYAGGAPAAPTAARLFALVNTNFGTPIVITALNAGIDPHSGQDVTGNGFTYVDSSSGSNVIRVVYDISQCNGNGIFAFDTGGNQITFPNVPLVYHELSHAFRAANGTTQTNDEIPAETDENVMRTALGLCQRNVNDHGGGCGTGNNCGGTTDDCGVGDGSTGCFIVTATTGSAYSTEVLRLRELREQVRRASGMGAQLIDTIYDEYFRFSPPIATRLQHDVIAREVVLQMVVRPLLAWYTLAGALTMEPARGIAKGKEGSGAGEKSGKGSQSSQSSRRSKERAIKQAAQTLRVVCPRSIAPSVVAMLEAIRAGEALPPSAPRLLQEFAPQLQVAGKLRYASWAILDPLMRAWTLASQPESRSAAAGAGRRTDSDKNQYPQYTHHLQRIEPTADIADLAEQIGEWLASAPLEEVIDVPKDHKQLDKELGVLADFLSFEPQARKDLGWRLSMAWPHAAGLLKRHGFI